MTTEIHLRNLQWFYDDAGYYSYVLLNATEDQVKSVQQALKDQGLQVLLTGRSYRPASNGVQYRWYIRVSDESGNHPAWERVQDILGPYAPAGVPSKKLKELADRLETQEEELGKLRATLSIKERLHQVAVQRAESLRKQNQELQAIYEKIQAELQEYRQKVHRLELRLGQLQEAALKPEDVAQLRQDYENAIQSLRRELEGKEAELASWISNFDPELQAREQKILDLESQLLDLQNRVAILEEEKMQLIDQFQEMRATREGEVERGNSECLFREMLSLLLPDVEFLAGSFDTLWREMQDPVGVLRELTNLAELRAKRVRKAEKWLEKHIEGEWRLYYRKCEDSKYQVLISHKNTQEADIDWLRRQ